MGFGDEEKGDRWQRFRKELEAAADKFGGREWIDKAEMQSAITEAYESGIDASLVLSCREACGSLGEFQEKLTSLTRLPRPWKILAVDDEQGFLDLLKINLERYQRYEVEVLASPDEALQRIESFKPDLVMLDIVMPGTDGIELVNTIRETEGMKDLPVIMLTALLDSGVAHGVTHEGLLHLSKPTTVKELVHCIEMHLAKLAPVAG